MQRTQVTVESPGEYPTKSRTPVADVCRYQNDGTKRITPARFIERAESEADGWVYDLGDAVGKYLDGAGISALKQVASEMAEDISLACDRVKTGRLKRSFTGRVITNGRG